MTTSGDKKDIAAVAVTGERSNEVDTTLVTVTDTSYEDEEEQPDGGAAAAAAAAVSDLHNIIASPIASTMAALFSSSSPGTGPASETSSPEPEEEGEPSTQQGRNQEQQHFQQNEQKRRRVFHNVGLETWLRAREEWRQRTVATLPPRPTPAEHAQLVRSLKRHSTLRTYELPRKMALSDLINVYQDIWDGTDL